MRESKSTFCVCACVVCLCARARVRVFARAKRALKKSMQKVRMCSQQPNSEIKIDKILQPPEMEYVN